MTRSRRDGFTLVELLVVIVIIGMLVGLVVPALIGARARARRTQCGNNQHELAVAFQQYETAKQHVPGYVNRFPATSRTGQSFSWPVVLLEYLGRGDLWEVWRDPNINVGDPTPDGADTTDDKIDPDPPNNRFAVVNLSELVCPVDFEAGDGGLSYVVNCGLEDDRAGPYQEDSSDGSVISAKSPDTAANGVFHDRYHTKLTQIPVRSEKIPDGAGQTLMLSENIQAGRWFDGCRDDPNPYPPSPDLDPELPPDTEANIGMVWVEYGPTGGPYVARTPDPPTSPDRWYRINEDVDYSGAPDIYHARPSSHHTGGVVVTYCDGRQGFLDEGIDYLVFARLMAPRDADAPLPP